MALCSFQIRRVRSVQLKPRPAPEDIAHESLCDGSGEFVCSQCARSLTITTSFHKRPRRLTPNRRLWSWGDPCDADVTLAGSLCELTSTEGGSHGTKADLHRTGVANHTWPGTPGCCGRLPGLNGAAPPKRGAGKNCHRRVSRRTSRLSRHASSANRSGRKPNLVGSQSANQPLGSCPARRSVTR